jgi:5-methylthioadenosine/S-adenosylhomocysteine deaminase
MTELLLHDNPASSNAQKVRLLLEVLGLRYSRRLVPFEKPRPDWHCQLNPTGGIPVLVDGPLILAESQAILRYLACRERRWDFYPRRLSDRARVEWLLDAISSIGLDGSGADEVIDARERIVIPGFVDSHRHLWQTLLRGTLGDLTIRRYIQVIRMHVASRFGPPDTYAATFAGAVDALNAGVTTIVDYAHNVNSEGDAREGLRALDDSGIRAVWAMGMLSAPGAGDRFAQDTEAKRGLFAELKRAYEPSPLLEVAMAPAELGFGDIDLATDEWRIARDNDAMVTLHANDLPNAGGEIELLDQAGLLGPDVLLVHCNVVSDREWQALRDAKTTISTQTESELSLASGMPIIAEARRQGLAPTIGVDSVALSSGDMFTQMRLALQFVREVEAVRLWEENPLPDELTVGAEEALAWATSNGAAAAGLDDRVGSLTPGKQADIVLLDTSDPSFLGWWGESPLEAAVFQASTSCVETVLVGGRQKKRDGHLVGEAAGKAAELARAAKAHIEESLRRDATEFVPNPLPALDWAP